MDKPKTLLEIRLQGTALRATMDCIGLHTSDARIAIFRSCGDSLQALLQGFSISSAYLSVCLSV